MAEEKFDFLLTHSHFGDTIERKYMHLTIRD
jgi:hypothetical protein